MHWRHPLSCNEGTPALCFHAHTWLPTAPYLSSNQSAVGNSGLNLSHKSGVQVPIYDFKLSKRVGYRTQKQPTSRVVIIEGIYSLSARLRQACGQNSFVVPAKTCFVGHLLCTEDCWPFASLLLSSLQQSSSACSIGDACLCNVTHGQTGVMVLPAL